MVDAAWVALSLCKNLGGKTFQALIARFNGDLPAILAASQKDLRSVRGIGPKIADAITQIDLPDTARRLNRWQASGVQILTWHDPAYPPVLRALSDSPPTIFVLGDLPDFQHAVAVVGTRTPDQDGHNLAQETAAAVGEAGGVVVSGMATGIDTMAHLGALSVPGGHTVAVLGNGILSPYPPENRGLAEAITHRGALICEVAPDAPVSAPGLVARNRIITGLSQAVVIVQTERDGGAMHAARFATVQERSLYTFDLPNSGNQALIRDGATVLDPDAGDLIDQFGIAFPAD